MEDGSDIYTLCRVNEDDTTNETVIILREGEWGRIITMMEAIIVAIYLWLWPPSRFASPSQMISNTSARRLGAGTAFASWLAAIRQGN